MSEALDFWAASSKAPALSEQEKELRERFVREYLYDFDIRHAAQRMGFVDQVAIEFGIRLYNDPYVQTRLAEEQKKTAEDGKVEDEDTKRRIRAALLREAHYHGAGSSHSARVSALAKLSAFYGMDAPLKSKVDIMHQGGVMAVPGIASLSDWEEAARASQGKLVEDTMNG